MILGQAHVLDIASGFLHLAGDSLVPTSISRNCLVNARVLQQVDKKFIPVLAGGTLAVIDQVQFANLLFIIFVMILRFDMSFLSLVCGDDLTRLVN